MYEQSPLKAVDPLLVAFDCVGVPSLLFLNVKLDAYREQQIRQGVAVGSPKRAIAMETFR